MPPFHDLLLRQLKRLGISGTGAPPAPEQWAHFLDRVSRAYTESDQDRYLLERSQEVSSREMQEVYRRLEEAQRIAGLGNWSFDRSDGMTQWSDECFRLFGLDPASDAPTYREFLKRVHEMDRETVDRLVSAAWIDGRDFEAEFRLLPPGGETRWVRALGRPVKNEEGHVTRLHGTVMDITRRKQAEDALKESEAHFRALVEQASDSFFVHDVEGRIIDVNQRACDSLGYARHEVIGRTITDIDADLSDDDLKAMLPRIAASAPLAVESRYRRKDGTTFPVEIRMGPIAIDGQQHLLSLVRDVTERRQLQDHIHHLAYHDHLTDLPNRAMFSRCLNHAIAQAHRYQKGLAVLFVDLDRFKIINDTLGHDAGDRLLQEMAERLAACLREGDVVARFDQEADVVARLGGDEFVVLIEEVADPARVGRIARKILHAIVREYRLNGQSIHVTGSIGISTFPEDGADEFTLMKHADIAMYRAKERGKNNYQFYSAQMNRHSCELLAKETGLRRALEREEFLLHYQPKVDIRSGRITGIEALVRWQHPELGLMAPGEFIPLAEETGLIVPIWSWVLREACARHKAWMEQGLPPVRIAVNLSPRQFTDENLPADIAHALDEAGMEPSLLELEITESMVMQNIEKAVEVMARLKAMGIRIAIDDFGTGHSSLAQLKRFPIDVIKVDRSFVQDIPEDRVDEAITHAIVAMARGLDIMVVAEGVETAEQLQILRHLGCHEMQGFLFSRPVTGDELSTLLRYNLEATASGAYHLAAGPERREGKEDYDGFRAKNLSRT